MNSPFVCRFSVAISVFNSSNEKIGLEQQSLWAGQTKENTYSNRAVVYKVRKNKIGAIKLFLFNPTRTEENQVEGTKN